MPCRGPHQGPLCKTAPAVLHMLGLCATGKRNAWYVWVVVCENHQSRAVGTLDSHPHASKVSCPENTLWWISKGSWHCTHKIASRRIITKDDEWTTCRGPGAASCPHTFGTRDAAITQSIAYYPFKQTTTKPLHFLRACAPCSPVHACSWRVSAFRSCRPHTTLC